MRIQVLPDVADDMPATAPLPKELVHCSDGTVKL